MLYSEKVMDHFQHPRNLGKMENADGVGEVGNAKCGDIMKMYIRVEDGIITGETAGYVMTYMDMVEKAKAITADLDARYAAFADAEAYLIENALVIPLSLPVPPYIATRLNLWEGQYAPTGFSTNRLKGIHILDHYVSMDEYNHNRDAR